MRNKRMILLVSFALAALVVSSAWSAPAAEKEQTVTLAVTGMT